MRAVEPSLFCPLPLSPSLISILVSVDVKQNVYLPGRHKQHTLRKARNVAAMFVPHAKGRIQYKMNTPCYKCITGTAPSDFCDCLQLFTPSGTLRSASDNLSLQILPPGFPLLVPAPFLSLVRLRVMTFPFLSDRNPLSTTLNQTSRHFSSQKYRPAEFSVQFRLKSLFAARFKLCVN